MNMASKVSVMSARAIVCAMLVAMVGSGKAIAGSVCGAGLTSHIPERQPAAPDGREFTRKVSAMSDDERESAILDQVLQGNIPSFLRRLSPVVLSARQATGELTSAIVCVSPDYLAIGTDENFLLVPMRLRTALTIATHFGFTLPTRKMVNAIYMQAPVHLQPQPLAASDTMRTTGYYWHHNELVLAQRLAMPEPLGVLTAGDKKDLVLTNRLWSNLTRVAIYGWHLPDGLPIQPLSTVHGMRYADYSHGIRLVSAVAYVNGEARQLLNMLEDPQTAALLSDEGIIRHAGELVSILSTQDAQAPAAASGLTR
jgi:hypothetical protein